MRDPSTAWAERIAPDEEAHLERIAEVIGALQRNRSAKYGPGRALHRKQLLATTGTLEVLDGLPEPARHGLFATPGTHPVLVRFFRGFALKVLDVAGPSVLGGTPIIRTS